MSPAMNRGTALNAPSTTIFSAPEELLEEEEVEVEEEPEPEEVRVAECELEDEELAVPLRRSALR